MSSWGLGPRGPYITWTQVAVNGAPLPGGAPVPPWAERLHNGACAAVDVWTETLEIVCAGEDGKLQ
eukprot:9180142-Pyramimonas_sp.AAC.1